MACRASQSPVAHQAEVAPAALAVASFAVALVGSSLAAAVQVEAHMMESAVSLEVERRRVSAGCKAAAPPAVEHTMAFAAPEVGFHIGRVQHIGPVQGRLPTQLPEALASAVQVEADTAQQEAVCKMVGSLGPGTLGVECKKAFVPSLVQPSRLDAEG